MSAPLFFQFFTFIEKFSKIIFYIYHFNGGNLKPQGTLSRAKIKSVALTHKF